jgi:glutamate N-acetyltransferase/amino-acid N-acetyltransferase
MTTDTVPKQVEHQVELTAGRVTIRGIAKGAGMICPDMATMLAFCATDAAVPDAVLQPVLIDAVADSFNAITIDGDTSTNDACVLMASGASGITVDALDSADGQRFAAAVRRVCLDLAEQIVRDGEGATKLVRIRVDEAADRDEARQVAYAVAHSPLVKTALFAGDPNWGRVLAAVGRAGLDALAIDSVRIWLDDVSIVRDGGRDPEYTEAAGQAVMARDALTVRIALGRGAASVEIMTCDLSYDYVKINAEYRS